eukprot:TRINITY_DN76722_c0_g1_i1.p1 TRINITY_DN76722_c0_g1~~TRINITY_DN76722_c0_g1_i1.p1  ORF type:complete len:405 (-),score=70.58 TRINITY_DN76722_c0_g1_i1:162-1331(-)
MANIPIAVRMLYGRSGQNNVAEAEPPAKKHKTETVANPNMPIVFSAPSFGSTSLSSETVVPNMRSIPGTGMSNMVEMKMMGQPSHMPGFVAMPQMAQMARMAQMAQMAQMMSAITGTEGMPGMCSGAGTQAMAAMPRMMAVGCSNCAASMPAAGDLPVLNPITAVSPSTGAVRPPVQSSRPTRSVTPTVQPVVEKRSAEEIKEALTKLGVSSQGLQTPREFQQKLHEAETWISRAEKTKQLVRFSDPTILSCFTEGLAPGSEGLLRMLEAGSDPNTMSAGVGSGFAAGMTPLLAACSWGKVDEVRLLIAAGADLSAKTPGIGHSAAHLVAGGNFQSWGTEKTLCLLRLLIDKAPALLQERNSMGKTPLDHAKYEKQRPQVNFLTNFRRA